MALTKGYEFDIFISYAHVDNLTFPDQTNGWIEQFYKYLSLLIARRIGGLDKVKIWWDNKKLDGTVLFDQSIETGIQKSAIMICLNSPSYMSSQYCKKELQAFYNKAKAEPLGLNVGNRSRIINVLLNNIPYQQWSSELSGTTGFPFHDAKEAAEFGNTVETISPEFKAQIQKLNEAVFNVLNAFPKEEPAIAAKPTAKGQTEEDAFTIFIGNVSDSLESQRKRTITELEKNGYKVLPGLPPPEAEAAHAKAAIAAIDSADLCIHLLNQYPGREIVGAESLWYPQKQTELALNSPKPQLIWMPSETNLIDVEEVPYRNFLSAIQTGKTDKKTFEFIRGSKSSLAQEIMNHAQQIKAELMVKKADSGQLSVLLDTHFNDQMYALDLSRTMLQNKIQPFINPQEDDPRKNINLMADRLSQVKKLIFIYGSVSKEWVLERMSAALQLIITNNYPIEDFYIFMAPPHKESDEIKLNQRFLKVNVIDSSKNAVSDEVMLSNFMTKLKMP